MSLLDNMPHTVTAKKRIRVSDGMGSGADTFEVVFTDRACWEQAASAKEIAEFKARGIAVTSKFYFTSNPELNETHVLVRNGRALEVRVYTSPDATAGLGLLWKVFAEETTTGSDNAN